MKRVTKIIGIILLLFGLILIRKFENFLFYDPFLAFFKQSKFNHLNPPEYESIWLFLSLFFRYALNYLLSIGIIHLWFSDRKITKFSSYILVVGFIIFCSLYFISISTNFGLGYMPTFYIRRILIQPILLLLLIPAIYYQKHLKKTNSLVD